MLTFHARFRLWRGALTLAVAATLQACGGSGSDSPATPSPGTDVPVVKSQLALLAGNVGGLGNLDGSRASATFYDIRGLTVDVSGNFDGERSR